ncbi:Na-Ca exchanger/integrin-beta4 [Sporocytophaga myxococcoides]|uniref:Na-Ca exchanger/integrin-beta4 n=1 Tax=Sporocytophaga myxococcoides TaxID=153721 RepID=A0A098LEQ5_9BACT|nr:hypothetical protein [Sporocytophaga myxococcoides]GAL85406.1 Na-Ca exchanger/integrin-beta4 [Sporocytophaga myxococcoides]
MKTSFLPFLMCILMPFYTVASLNPGDIVIIEYNASNPDQFSFLSLSDVPENEVIYFTDCGWSKDGLLRRSEGLIKYVVPQGGLSIGTVITYTADQKNNNGFTTTGIDGFFGLAQGGDQLLVFQGNFDSPVFLFGLNNLDGIWQDDATTTNSSALPPGLEIGKTAVNLSGGANASFDCTKIVKDKNQMLENISNPLNWNYSSSQILQASLCSFSILPIVLLKFEANVFENEVILNCQLGSCTNNSRVIIERSEDGTEFEIIFNEVIQGASPLVEFLTNDKRFNHSKYYRLYLNQQLIKTILVEGKMEADNWPLQPEEIGIISLFSADGRKIAETTCYGNELKIKADGFNQNLETGIYFYTVVNNNGKKVVRKFYKY